MIETRSSGGNCENLIINGDFEWNWCLNGLNAMNNNTCSAPWQCYYGSPDVVGWVWDWSNVSNDQWWDDQTFSSAMAFMCCGNHADHTEGFTQKVQMNPLKSYRLSLDVSSTTWDNRPDNGDLTLHGQFDSDLPTNCSSGGILPDCNPTATCFEVSVPYDYIYPQMLSITMDLPVGIDKNAIYFWAETDISDNNPLKARGIFVDNINLICTNPAIHGISVVDNGKCEFSFSPVMDNPLDIDEISWDFGDGSVMSNETNPRHVFAGFGVYTVTMTITDLDGCCTTKTISVACENPICDYYVCWAGEKVTMQKLEMFEGITLTDLNGIQQEIVLFSPPIQIEGGYQQIFTALTNLLVNQYGLSPFQIVSNDPAINCTKGGYDVPGFFINDTGLIIDSFNGFLDNAGSVGGSVDFTRKDCN